MQHLEPKQLVGESNGDWLHKVLKTNGWQHEVVNAHDADEHTDSELKEAPRPSASATYKWGLHQRG